MTTGIEAPHRRLGDAMVEDHDRIEALLDRILDDEACQSGTQTERWLECAALIREHLDIEDFLLLPAFELAQPAIARALCADHTRIRLLCAEIGIALDLRSQQNMGIVALSSLLRAHHRREAMAMYNWGRQDNGASLSEGLRALLMSHGGGPPPER